MLMLRLLSLGAAVATALAPQAPPPPVAAPAAEVAPLSRDEVRRLVAAGLGDATLPALVRERGLEAPLSIPEILSLRELGASDGTLSALVRFSTPRAAASGVDLDVKDGALVVTRPRRPPPRRRSPLIVETEVVPLPQPPSQGQARMRESRAEPRVSTDLQLTIADPRADEGAEARAFERKLADEAAVAESRRLAAEARAAERERAAAAAAAERERQAVVRATMEKAVRDEVARRMAALEPKRAPVQVVTVPVPGPTQVVPVAVPVPYPVPVASPAPPPPDDGSPHDGVRRIPLHTSHGTIWVPN